MVKKACNYAASVIVNTDHKACNCTALLNTDGKTCNYTISIMVNTDHVLKYRFVVNAYCFMVSTVVTGQFTPNVLMPIPVHLLALN